MSYSERMLAMAARAGAMLGPDLPCVAAFIRGRMNPDGGFAGRDGASDIYYTAFALDVLAAAGAAPPREAVAGYVSGIAVTDALDPFHIACLARCWKRLGLIEAAARDGRGAAVVARLERHRAVVGGYNTVTASGAPSVTGTFVTLLAYSDLDMSLPEGAAAVEALDVLRAGDGAYANERGLAAGTVLASAGVLIMRHWLGLPADPDVSAWLARQHRPGGGFPSSSGSPAADLLSTATALYALRLTGAPMPAAVVEGCTAFVDGLMEDGGGFGGHWLDDTPDCEYTYYALLVYGCLADVTGR